MGPEEEARARGPRREAQGARTRREPRSSWGGCEAETEGTVRAEEGTVAEVILREESQKMRTPGLHYLECVLILASINGRKIRT